MKDIGDQYVKSEFRLHRGAEQAQARQFLAEWSGYAVALSRQLGVKGVHQARPLGAVLQEAELDHFTDEQLGQLYELYKTIQEDDTKGEDGPTR